MGAAWILVLAVGSTIYALRSQDDGSATASAPASSSGPSSSGPSSSGPSSSTDEQSASESSTPSPTETGTPGETGQPTSSTSTGCRAQVAGADAVVEAARVGIDHLETHTGAHQAWVEGRISEEQKSALYKATRLAGPADVARFAAAQKAAQKTAQKTAQRTTRRATAGTQACTPPQRACAERMETLSAAMTSGRSGMAVWEEHLANMADFAAGKFDSDRAQALWDRTRAEAQKVIASWDKADQAVRQAPRCG